MDDSCAAKDQALQELRERSVSASPESRVGAANYRIAAALDASLAKVAGERMGFMLVVFPLGRTGESVMCSNVKRAQAEKVMEAMLEQAEPDLFVPYTGRPS